MVDETGANPQGATENLSFRDRMTARLAAERGEPQEAPEGYAEALEEANPTDEPAETAGEGYEEALDPARQADGELEPEPQEPTGESEPDDAVAETSEDDTDLDVNADIKALTAERDDALERARSMERDYRIKTHKIAAATRDLEDTSGVVQKQADFMLNLAEQGVSQFDSVNWDQLRTKPEQYQQAKQAYDNALQTRDTLKKHLGGIADQHRDLLDTAKRREAEVSKDILKTTIKDWSNELYGHLRSYAVEELFYTEAEFDEMTDWRRIRDIHAQYQLSQTPTEVVTLRRKKAKQPVTRQRERKTAQTRNAQGKFQSARQAFFDNPGDPESRRDYFRQKLAAERNR